MYDVHTSSLWHALTGEPVIGPLAHSGLKLTILPVTTTTWAEWRDAHPGTRVLSVDTGFRRPYLHHGDPQSAYFEYFADPGLMFPAFNLDGRLRAKDQVLAIRFDGMAKAYLLDALAGVGVLNDTFADRELVVVADRLSRAARAYDRGGHVFRQGEQARTLIDESGTGWRIEESALVSGGPTPERLVRIPSHTAYWFGWYAFFPNTEVYR